MKEVQDGAPATNEEPLRSYPLQDRDRQLLTALAMCRCLSTEQVRRLCFSGRTETPAHKRLRHLAGIGKYGFPEPLVERTVHQPTPASSLRSGRPQPWGTSLPLTLSKPSPGLRAAPRFARS